MDIEIKGLSELKKRLSFQAASGRLRQTMAQVVLSIAAYVKNQKLSGQVLNIRTNRLKSSINGVAQAAGDIITGKIGTNVVYARIHELGGTIKAKNVQYLRFNIGGRWFFKKEVTIPKRPYLKPSLADNKEFIRKQFQKTVDLMLSGK